MKLRVTVESFFFSSQLSFFFVADIEVKVGNSYEYESLYSSSDSLAVLPACAAVAARQDLFGVRKCSSTV